MTWTSLNKIKLEYEKIRKEMMEKEMKEASERMRYQDEKAQETIDFENKAEENYAEKELMKLPKALNPNPSGDQIKGYRKLNEDEVKLMSKDLAVEVGKNRRRFKWKRKKTKNLGLIY